MTRRAVVGQAAERCRAGQDAFSDVLMDRFSGAGRLPSTAGPEAPWRSWLVAGAEVWGHLLRHCGERQRLNG